MLDILFSIKLLSIVLFAIFCLLNMLGFTMNALNARRQSVPVYRMASIIMFIMAIQSILSLDLILPYSHVEDEDGGKAFEQLVMLADMLIVPCVVMLVRRLARANTGSHGVIFMHLFIPVSIFIAYAITTYQPIVYFALGFYVIYGAFYFFSIIGSIKRYERALKNTYSDTQGRSIKWLYTFTYVLVGELSLWAITRPTFATSTLSFAGYYIVSICVWWWLSNMLRGQVLETSEIDAYLHTANLNDYASDTADRDNIKKVLDEYFKKHDLYRRPDLTISQLALEVGILREELTGWFLHTGTSFNSYIKKLRLEAATRMLETSYEDAYVIGAMCGFTHRNAFEEAFQTKYGCTPEEYRAANKQTSK